jgi:phenylpyruvate tautomerase PptA (4-oxalocrotonate tautomerase family)
MALQSAKDIIEEITEATAKALNLSDKDLRNILRAGVANGMYAEARRQANATVQRANEWLAEIAKEINGASHGS